MSADEFSDIVCPFAGGVRLTVRARPGMSRARAVRVVDIGDEKRAVEISIAAQAEDGKANRALIERLAEALAVNRRSIEIKSGTTGRIKIIEIIGNSDQLGQKIREILG